MLGPIVVEGLKNGWRMVVLRRGYFNGVGLWREADEDVQVAPNDRQPVLSTGSISGRGRSFCMSSTSSLVSLSLPLSRVLRNSPMTLSQRHRTLLILSYRASKQVVQGISHASKTPGTFPRSH